MKILICALGFFIANTAISSTINVNCGELAKIKKNTLKERITVTFKNGTKLIHTRDSFKVKKESSFSKLKTQESYKYVKSLENHYQELSQIMYEQDRSNRPIYTCYGSIVSPNRWHRVISSSQISQEDAFSKLIQRYQK